MPNYDVPQEWHLQQVKELSETYAGGTPSRNVSGMFGGSIPWVKSSELNRDEISYTEEKLTDLGYRSSSVKWIPANTPLIAMYGATAGIISWLKIPAVTNQAVLAIPPRNESIHSRWLYWVLNFYANKLIATVQGSGQPNLSKKLIDELEVGKPLLISEQQKITEILDTVNDLITIIDRHIAKLKQAKAGLLHDLLTHGIDEHGELRDPIRHPEQFKDSLLGRIPKEWDFGRISDFYAIPPRNGLYKHAQYYGRGSLMIHMPQMFRGLEIDISDAVRVEVSSNEVERFGVTAQ